MVKQIQTICRQFDAKWSNLLAKWANYITSCVPGSKHGQLRFQDFRAQALARNEKKSVLLL